MGFGPLLEEKLCLIFKLATSVCRMTFPIWASLLVRFVVLLPFQLLRLSRATPSRWTPLALSVFLHCVVALLLFFFSSRRRHTRCSRDWSSDVCSSDLLFSKILARNINVANLVFFVLCHATLFTAFWFRSHFCVKSVSSL